jgi:hypothetical protein
LAGAFRFAGDLALAVRAFVGFFAFMMSSFTPRHAANSEENHKLRPSSSFSGGPAARGRGKQPGRLSA